MRMLRCFALTRRLRCEHCAIIAELFAGCLRSQEAQLDITVTCGKFSRQ